MCSRFRPGKLGSASRQDWFVVQEGVRKPLSTLPNSAVLFPDWKQEINRRVAAHKSARGASQSASTTPAPAPLLGASAAKAAARVAARFAGAPTYSEMLAREARAAMDAAKAAAKAAEEAQAAFQFVLDGLEAAPVEPEWQLEALSERIAEPLATSLASDLLDALPQPANHSNADQPSEKLALWESEVIGVTEAAAAEQAVQPIFANLIEFPRPMVAVRRARPRLAEGPLAGSAPQLSIFEVEPTAISTEPPPVTEDLSAPPSWMRTQWPESTADEWLPARDSDVMPLARRYAPAASVIDSEAFVASPVVAVESIVNAQQWEELSAKLWSEDDAAARSVTASSIEVASLGRRLLAVVVDAALSVAVLVVGALVAVPHVSQLPSARVIALCAVLALLVTGFAYHVCFFALFRSTPGMLYAGIEIDTLSGAVPARRRRWFRLAAMLLSLLPLGLGFLWALFDDDNLAWHDRLSGTYLRRR